MDGQYFTATSSHLVFNFIAIDLRRLGHFHHSQGLLPLRGLCLCVERSNITVSQKIGDEQLFPQFL